MEADEVMELYDSYWFQLGIFEKQPNSANLLEIEEEPSKPELLRIPTLLHTRAMSDELSSKTSFNFSFCPSPDSVLHRPKLSTILSGKEATEVETPIQRHVEESPKKITRRRRKKKKKGESKSLTDLQFEELKGFMDLGFVFSEEDKEDSNLASIIPGLQRLGKDGQDEVFDESAIPRPYLSEAWKVRDQRKREKPLMNWRFPALGNEIDMKDNLRWWAHTVASTVR
ncbi:hypothetical protein PRUPE_4G066000 [Prunus persica]|uniref:DUF1685 domain-containing protein n=1 Tax=Prunus persica TaxID=3760 RepID=M5WYZ3_PRUPE|nr:uncharacterized protein LOC18780991 [Prunus persica]ONI10751.1 hypothetical protein PRUPE_4G066000 [Prunus persica]